MSAGESAAATATSMSDAAERLRERADRIDAVAEQYRKGAEGEAALVAALEPLTAAGWTVLADRSRSGTTGNIDVIAIGPGGVFAIDAKHWSGTLAVEDGSLRQNGHRRDDALEGVRTQAAEVTETLARSGAPGLTAWPVLCFTGEAASPSPEPLGGVVLTGVATIEWSMRNLPPVLPPEWVAWCSQVLDATMPARVGERIDVVPAAPPAEDVLFLTQWSKASMRRCYVKDENGTQGGYIDLTDHTVHAADDGARAVLDMLVPFAARGTAGESPTDGSPPVDPGQSAPAGDPPATSVASPTVVVASQWRGHGHQRLYVHRLFTDGRSTPMGFFDLTDGRTYDTAGVDDEAVVRYCGLRFLDLREPQHEALPTTG
ncbi:MAG: nuclease-related domain-containing protein [Microthrixaceae bacterium]